eukprot:scaffold7254_cov115-Isochrysis_galbana.AAC.3
MSHTTALSFLLCAFRASELLVGAHAAGGLAADARTLAGGGWGLGRALWRGLWRVVCGVCVCGCASCAQRVACSVERTGVQVQASLLRRLSGPPYAGYAVMLCVCAAHVANVRTAAAGRWRAK